MGQHNQGGSGVSEYVCADRRRASLWALIPDCHASAVVSWRSCAGRSAEFDGATPEPCGSRICHRKVARHAWAVGWGSGVPIFPCRCKPVVRAMCTVSTCLVRSHRRCCCCCCCCWCCGEQVSPAAKCANRVGRHETPGWTQSVHFAVLEAQLAARRQGF